jgi:tripartite-type tricarboxylate transporter receptor subunit TctC
MQPVFRALLFAASTWVFPAAQAQTYPTKSVRVIASVLPGDTCDVLVRLLGHKMGERLGQQFVIDNRAGASGQRGHAMVAQAPPAGYTLGCGNGGSLAIVPHAFNYPDYPTIAETQPGFVSGGWFGIVGPAGIPRDIVTLHNREANRALNLPEIRDKLVASGLDLTPETPEYFARFMRCDRARYGKIAKVIGLQPQ